MYKLGPEGRAMQNRMTHTTTISQSGLDQLLGQLVMPNEGLNKDPTKIFSYLAYYYPKLANKSRVQQLTESFLRCPVFFNDSAVVSFKQNFSVVYLFRYIMETKYAVSIPTLSFADFYHAIFGAVYNLRQSDYLNWHWKAIPMLCGILLSIAGRRIVEPSPENASSLEYLDGECTAILNESITKFAKNSPLMANYDLKCLVVACAACTKDRILDKTISSFKKCDPTSDLFITEMMLSSPYGFQVSRMDEITNTELRPLLNHLNGLALYFERSLPLGDLKTIYSSTDTITTSIQFISRDVCKFFERNPSVDMENFKKVYYASILIFQSIVSLFISRPSPVFQDAARRMLTSLYYLNPILMKIGSGGFSSFQFVYFGCIDCISSHTGITDSLLRNLMAGVSYERLDMQIEQEKLLFFLELSDQLLYSCSNNMRFNLILPFVERVINDDSLVSGTNSTPILEAAHSVYLKWFTIAEIDPLYVKTNGRVICGKILRYIDTVVSQFPSKLSHHQLDIAFQTIARLIFSNGPLFPVERSLCRRFLNGFFNYCVREPFVASEKHSRKTLLTLTLLKLIPLVSTETYVPWLKLVDGTLISVSSEKEALISGLWDTLLDTNKKDQQKGSLGFSWWYATKGARL